jgi:hypothetical protein
LQGLPLQLVLVLQPPVPLQSFFPFSAPQPPLPLQEFFPAQQCFSTLVFVVFPPVSSVGLGVADTAAVVPATKPVSAAPIRSFRAVLVI